MPEGTVVKYNEKTGIGLARPDDGGKDIFLHRDYLKDKAGKGFAIGLRIRFNVGRGYRGQSFPEARGHFLHSPVTDGVPSIYQHTFRWQGNTIRLIYSIADERGGLQLVLDDVQASSSSAVSGIPDWKIESEASAVAMDYGARYL